MDPFTCFSYSWYLDEEGGIHIFALSPENKSIHLNIQNFTPYMYMELPDGIEWNTVRKNSILSVISELPSDIQPKIKSYMDKKRLYYANVEKKGGNYDYKTFPYLFLAFQ